MGGANAPPILVGTSWLARPPRVRLQLNIRCGPIAKDPLSRSAGLAKAATTTWCSRTPRRAAAGIALHAGAIPHQREVAALRAHLAFVALGLGFRAAFGLGGDERLCGAAGLAPLEGL